MTPRSTEASDGGRRRRAVLGLKLGSTVAAMSIALAALPGCGAGEPAPGGVDRLFEGRPAEAVPAFGMMAWQGLQLDRADFATIRRAGAPYYRFSLTTEAPASVRPGLRPQAGAVARKFDRLVAAATAEGVDILPVLLRSRPAAGGRKRVGDPPRTARELATWRERVRAYVDRYGPRGTFWTENPDLPYRPFRAWEVWNEPNLRVFWEEERPNVKQYARLLREARSVIRRADPEARVLLGGLAWRYSGPRYLAGVLEETGGCAVDAIAIHPYAKTASRAMKDLGHARAIADERGAEQVPLWTTEIGWKIGGGGHSAVRDERAQARELDRFARLVAVRRAELQLGPSFVFALRDRVNPATGRVNHASGLRRADGSPRPAWTVWSRWATASPLALPKPRRCGGGRGDARGG